MNTHSHETQSAESIRPQMPLPSDAGVISVFLGAVGWVVARLYSSGNPQVRAYYHSEPPASPAKKPQARAD
jgi:hypothetical protein